MKKHLPASKVEDFVCCTGYQTKRRARKPGAKDVNLEPTQPKVRRKVSYIPEVLPRDEPPEIPRLFIQGPIGGSFKMDLLGIGVELSEAAFAYWVPDQSLKNLHIHRGDIAIIDPTRLRLKVGDLMLLGLDGITVLRRLVRKRRIWYVESADGTKLEPQPLMDNPLYGRVLGVMRLFTKVRAIRFRGTDARFKASFEQSGSGSKCDSIARDLAAKVAHSKTKYRACKRAPFLLASEKPSPSRLSEIDEKTPYSTRAKTR